MSSTQRNQSALTPIQATYDVLMRHVGELRALREPMDAERNRLANEFRAVRELPPDRGTLKVILRRVFAGFQPVWNKNLIERLEGLKKGFDPEEFIERHVSLAGNAEFVDDNGWFAFLGYAMVDYVDQFVDGLDWPEGISTAARESKLAKLTAELDALNAKIWDLDAQMEAVGISPKAPQKVVESA